MFGRAACCGPFSFRGGAFAMLTQLIIGVGVIALSLAIQAAFVGFGIEALRRFEPWLSRGPLIGRTVIVLTGLTLWLLLGLSVVVWIWAGLLLGVGAFPDLETSVYFAGVALTTLGFGDLLLPLEWRQLGGLIAANGLLLFGLNTAFLFEAVARLWVRSRR